MGNVIYVLRSVAAEIVDRVETELPALEQDELIIGEKFDHGVYTRVTQKGNEVTEYQLNLNEWNMEGANYFEQKKRTDRKSKSVCG